MQRAAGDSQTVVVGSASRDSLVARVVDQYGNPVPGVAVGWSVAQGGGALSNTSPTTDAQGRSWTKLTVGNTAMENRVTASVGSLPVATFVAHGVAGGVATITITPDSIDLTALQQTTQLAAVARDRFGNAVVTTIDWRSLDAAVAVDANGNARAQANGRARIVAQAGTVADTAVVRVGQRAATISLLPATHTFSALLDTLALTADVRDANGHVIAGAPVAFEATVPGIATVENDGRVISRDNGDGRIVATSGDARDTTAITVRQVAMVLTLSPQSDPIVVGETTQLTATATDSNGVAIAERAWRSSNAWVATVDANGLVRGESPGTAVITVEAGTREASTSILVKQPPTGRIEYGTVAVGYDFACALTRVGGSAYCWGLGATGQLGAGALPEACEKDFQGQTTPCSPKPLAVVGGLSFTMLAAGGNHVCGITTEQLAYCWGYNGRGASGGTSFTTCGLAECYLAPNLVSSTLRFARITAGEFHTCAITPGSVGGDAYCWGQNNFGQLGIGESGTTSHRREPTLVSGGHKFGAISAKAGTTCALDASGAAWCWGNGLAGWAESTTPSKVSGTGTPDGAVLFNITVGEQHACGASADGNRYCWGAGGFSGGSDAPGLGVRPLAPGVSAIHAGRQHSCGLSLDDAFCWGQGGSGRLGTGDTNSRNLPTLVTGGLKFNSVDSGYLQSCGVDDVWDVYCWGSNWYGALGYGAAATMGDSSSQMRAYPSRVAQP